MQITDIKIRKVEGQNRLRAVVSITIDSAFVVHELRIIEGQKGLFVAMPNKKTPQGEYKDVAHPINAETRQMIEECIIAKYNEEEAA